MNLSTTAQNIVKASSINVDLINPSIVNLHAESSLDNNKASLNELTAEMSKGLLQGEEYEQEKILLEALIESKKTTSTELNQITWICPECRHENTDLLKETSMPLCGGCDNSFFWEAVEVDVSTYFGNEETTVKLNELYLLDKDVVDSGVELSKENITTQPFTTLIPSDKIPAYWGSFGEYVPVMFENQPQP